MTSTERSKAAQNGKMILRVSFNGRRGKWMIAQYSNEGSGGWNFRFFGHLEFDSYEKAFIHADEYVTKHNSATNPIILE
ncbi:MAG: hypothetical protein ACOYMF_05425 [Bacteroidales bacterium]